MSLYLSIVPLELSRRPNQNFMPGDLLVVPLSLFFTVLKLTPSSKELEFLGWNLTSLH